MSDEREQDAALVARRREWYDTATAYMAAQEMPAIAWGIQWEKDLGETGAWLRTIARLTAERDQAREQLAKLEEACKDVPEMLEYSLDYLAHNEAVRSFRRAVTAIRAALGSESEAGE